MKSALLKTVGLAIMVSACSSMAAHPAGVVTLEVLSDGTYAWNGERIPDVETLERYWKMVAAQDPRPEIHLKPNRDAQYDAVARALEGAQRNGVTKLGFVGNVAPQASHHVPARLTQVAECISSTLKSVPGIENVRMQITTTREGTFPTISYRFVDNDGRGRDASFPVYMTKDDAGRDLYAFDSTGAGGFRVANEGSPVQNKLLDLEIQCGATGIIIT